MSRFLVRVELADRPGALGAVASRIGAVRGDVVGVEILDRHGGRALDEFLVELPDGAHVDLLTSEIEEVDGAVVETVHSLAAGAGDARTDAYDGAAAFVAERSPEGALQLLTGLARRELSAAWSAVVDTGTAAGFANGNGGGSGVRVDVAVVCADGPAPAGCWLAAYAFDVEHGGRLPAAEIAWAPLAAWDLALAVGRPGRRFVDAERSRLEALARLGDARWADLSRSRSRSRHEHPSRAG
jgi:hypothetical protein